MHPNLCLATIARQRKITITKFLKQNEDIAVYTQPNIVHIHSEPLKTTTLKKERYIIQCSYKAWLIWLNQYIYRMPIMRTWFHTNTMFVYVHVYVNPLQFPPEVRIPSSKKYRKTTFLYMWQIYVNYICQNGPLDWKRQSLIQSCYSETEHDTVLILMECMIQFNVRNYNVHVAFHGFSL